jgi:hypothetical protein
MKAARRIAALVLVTLAFSATSAFALVHAWSHQYAGTSAQGFSCVATDASGNIYAAGAFYNTTNFGGGNRTSNGGGDIMLVKFNSAGVYQWDRTFGDASDTQVSTGVGIDLAGNVYIGGFFMGGVNFGGGTLTSLGDRDLFVAKFNSAGTYQWAKRYGDAAEQFGQDLTVDIGDNVYFTGYYKGSVDFGGGALTNQGSYDAFLVKLDTAGAHLWSKRFGDAGDQRGTALATDHWGNIFFGMSFTGTVDMGAGDVTSAGNFDVEVVQYGSAGNYQWAHRYGDSGNQQVQAIATEAFEGYPYIAGSNAGVMDFGGGPITSAGSFDVFLAKLDCFGNHLWSNGWGDAGDQDGTALAVDPSGDVYLAGAFDGAMNLGGGLLTSAGNQDIFLAKFTEGGSHVWSHRYGDPAKYQIPAGLATDSDYHVVMAGQFQGTVDFGGGPLTGADLDAFIVQFGQDPTGVRTPLRNEAALWASPNPFNPLTVVHYSVPQPGHVRVDIFDARGARVTTLVNREHHAGSFTATWHGVDDAGMPASSGVYFARLTTTGTVSNTKLVLVK